MTYPYTLNTGKVPRFLEHIQTAGVPSKFNNSYLSQTEFKSSNDRALVPLMKALNFTDSSGTPTDRWRHYRNRELAGGILADGIRECYSALFEMYPDADKQTADTIRNFMSGKVTVGEKALTAMVQTFRTLCSKADFSIKPSDQATGVATSEPIGRGRTVVSRQVGGVAAPVVLNINLTIEASDDPDVYDRFYAAMRRHLIDVD